ncbi:hypothetical protein [Kitasatospora sp. NPDC057541]|uniref:hypothetical protein n=1 Tax=unclassified Kitasatospora TaxID=2633591 RepID=UPI0036CCB4DB
MSTGHTGPPIGPPPGGQWGHTTGSGDSLNAGNNINIIQPPPPPPPPRRSRGWLVAVCLALVCAAVAGALVERKLTEGDAVSADTRTAAAPQSSPAAPAQPTVPPASTAPPPASAEPGFTLAPTTTAPAPAPVPVATTPPPPTTTAPAKDAVRYNGPVRLSGSIDLDANPPQLTGDDAPGVLGGFGVLYTSYTSGQGAMASGRSGVFPNFGPGLAPYKDDATPTRKRCSDLLRSQATDSLVIETNTRFCVRTVNGRIGLMTVEDYAAAPFGSGAFNGHALIWEGVG